MGLVLAAPADLLAPLVEKPGPAPAQSVPADGLFASLLASLSAMDGSESSEPLMEATALPAAPSADEESAEEPDTDPFAALLAMSVALPIAAPPTETGHREWTVSQDGGHVAGVHGWSNGIEVNKDLSEIITTAMAAQSAETVAGGTEIPTEATVAETGIAQPFTQPTEETTSAAAAAPTPLATEAMASVAQTSARRTNDEAPEVRPWVATASSQTSATGDTGATTETQGVVRSVGNAESNETPARDGNSKENGGKETVERGIPRASARGVLHAADTSAVAQLRTPDAPAPADAVVPLPTEQAGVAEAPPQVEQVAQTVIDSVEVGRSEARIHLDPAGMGEVTIHVRAEHGDVRVEIRAERQEAAQLLRDHTRDLSNLLGERGLNLSDVNVGLGRGNGDQAWGRDENQHRNTSGNEFASILGIDEPTALETHNRLRAAYNPDGALVYRV